MRTIYSVTIKNNSMVDGQMCVFQKLPEQAPNIFSLAWFAKQCNRNTTLKFEWKIWYCANWAETAKLKPGVIFQAGQCVDADPSDPERNSFTLSYINGGYQFKSEKNKAPSGTIGIYPDNSVPNLKASVGVGMNGEPAFACQALMNYDFIFIPKVRYYLIFGNYQRGQVMDLSSSTHALEIVFPTNIFNRTIEMREDNRFYYID